MAHTEYSLTSRSAAASGERGQARISETSASEPDFDRGPLVDFILHHRRWGIVVLHLAMAAGCNWLAFWLRFDGVVPPPEARMFRDAVPWLVATRGLTFIPFRLYGGLWRYTGIWDLRNIIAAVLLSTGLFYIEVHWVLGIVSFPRSVFFVDSVLLICCAGGIRLTRRIVNESRRAGKAKRVLIFGAGDAGEMIARDMMRYEQYQPIGFVDDDPSKVGQHIHGVPVLGRREQLAAIFASHKPQEVLVAIPRADPATISGVVKALEPFKVPITTVPHIRDLMNGDVAVSQIRRLSIEDLLPRAPVGLSVQSLQQLISGKCILVTGAGGSIGSELCRQIVALGPSRVILYERYENGLYTIVNDLIDHGAPPDILHAVIGDVTDAERLNMVFEEHRPAIVFHAAAHKHVPLMELNPCEAVKNNVIGTQTVAETAIRFGVSRFVLISTDKAVNPSNVMGATKRIAELIVQSMVRRQTDSTTGFVIVRFGNVMGSNGSVLPRFVDQVKAGGPVTVTHPEVRRYFMLIPEAVQLVLHAAGFGDSGALYVLHMGDQIKLLDMARNLIRLSGFVPDEEIPITFTGLRPGEKLSEELVGADETVEPSPVEKILRVYPLHVPNPAMLAADVLDLIHMARLNRTDSLLKHMAKMVPSLSQTDVESVNELLLPQVAAPEVLSFQELKVTRRRRERARVFADRRVPERLDRRNGWRGGRRLTDLLQIPRPAIAKATIPEKGTRTAAVAAVATVLRRAEPGR